MPGEGLDVKLRVDGLRELRKELRAIDAAFPKELRAANKQVAEQVVVPEARRRAGALTRPRVGSRLLATIRALASQTSATVAMGGARTPYARGMEFGSIRRKQFAPWRGNDRNAGYFLYPTIRERSDDIVETYSRVIDELTERAFPR